MGLLDDCSLYFACKTLYEVLNIENNSSDNEIKKAYRKASLLHHPDKAEGSKRDEATRKFQVLAKVYCILSDSEKRALYDETGLVDDENSFSADSNSPDFWTSYWRNLFPKITAKDIKAFMKKYTGSEDEKKDLKKYYMKYEGNMNNVSNSFIGYENADSEDRVTAMINEMIESGEVPAFPNFTKEPAKKKAARIKKLRKEAKEAAEDQAEPSAMDDLASMIAQRNAAREQGFNNMIASLEAKYAKPDGRKKRKT